MNLLKEIGIELDRIGNVRCQLQLEYGMEAGSEDILLKCNSHK